MLKLEAVVGVLAVKDFKAWETIQDKKARQVRLNGDTNFAEIGTIFAGIAHELKISNNASPVSTLETIAAHGKFPDGAIRFTDDAETEKRAIHTGCCFGINSWSDLLAVNTNEFVWLGHSPMPEIECLPDGTIKIWADGAKKSDEDSFFELTRREFRAKVLELEKDLLDFTALLELWAEQIGGAATAGKAIEKFNFGRRSF